MIASSLTYLSPEHAVARGVLAEPFRGVLAVRFSFSSKPRNQATTTHSGRQVHRFIPPTAPSWVPQVPPSSKGEGGPVEAQEFGRPGPPTWPLYAPNGPFCHLKRGVQTPGLGGPLEASWGPLDSFLTVT